MSFKLVIGHKIYLRRYKTSLKGLKSDLSKNFCQIPFQESEINVDPCGSGSMGIWIHNTGAYCT
jgi:hypothetical protein